MAYHLKAFELEDAADLRDMLDDPDTLRFSGSIPANPSLNWAEERIRTRNLEAPLPQEHGLFLSGQLVASVGWFESRLGGIEIGYSVHPQHRGKGHSAPALAAIVGYVHNVLKHRDIIKAGVDQNNVASIKVLERGGFQRVGEGIFVHPIRGTRYAQYRYELPALCAD